MKKESTKQLNVYFIPTLYIISVVCGSVLMAIEVVGGRLLSPYFGSSVYVWGSIISVFMIALSAGYYLGGQVADKKPNLFTLIGIIGLSGLLIILIPILVLPVVKFTYSVGLGNFGALFVAMALFFLPSMGLGMVSPFVVKLGISETSRLGNLVGRFYSTSTFGSILGTLLTTFVLIPLFGVKEVMIACGILLVILSALAFCINRLFLHGVASLLLLAIFLSLVVTLTPSDAEAYAGSKLLYKKETLYNNIAVVDAYDGYRYLMFNETQQSVMNKNAPMEHVWPYTRLMDAAADYYKPHSKNELLIGLGGGSIPKFSLANRPNENVDAVDIDPEVINVAEKYFNMPKDSRLKTHAVDGRMYLQDKKQKYDVIMIDAYNRLSIPYHLTTKEFFEELSTALKPDGVVIFNIVSSVEGEYSKFFKSVLKTATQVFPNYRLFNTEQNDPNEIDNLIMVVSKDKLVSPGTLAGCKEYKEPIDVKSAIVLTDNYAPVDTLAVKIMTKVY